MIEAISCGGVVIFRGKILLLYKNYMNKSDGWVLPKGTVEDGEEYTETALREVKEETGVTAQHMVWEMDAGDVIDVANEIASLEKDGVIYYNVGNGKWVMSDISGAIMVADLKSDDGIHGAQECQRRCLW